MKKVKKSSQSQSQSHDFDLTLWLADQVCSIGTGYIEN
jgi:hypothetical protein